MDTQGTPVQERHPPPDVVGQQRHVEAQREPLGRTEEHDAEEDMDQVLRQNQLQTQHKQSVSGAGGGPQTWLS